MTTGTVPSAPTIPVPAINHNPNNRRGGGRNQHNNNNHQNYRRNYGNRGPALYFVSDLMHHPPPFHPNGPPPPPGPVQYWPLPLGWDVYRATTNIVHRPPHPLLPSRPLPPLVLQNGGHHPVLSIPCAFPASYAGRNDLARTAAGVAAKLMGDIWKQI